MSTSKKGCIAQALDQAARNFLGFSLRLFLAQASLTLSHVIWLALIR